MKFLKEKSKDPVLCGVCESNIDANTEYCFAENINHIKNIVCQTCVKGMQEVLFGLPPVWVKGKPSVGKIFKIKKFKNLSCRIGNNPTHGSYGVLKREQLPECVVIVDEKNKWLSFIYNNTQYWLSRGFFGGEVI